VKDNLHAFLVNDQECPQKNWNPCSTEDIVKANA
jgi:triphosphoribosyl-dephospho-CoA synthetase